jgi:hypothetical protein
LEEDCTEAEIGMRVDASVFCIVKCAFGDRHIMEETKLWIRFFHKTIKESRVKV